VLKNIRAVVSTHQVLYDALSHGFVRLEGLALLIFDEGYRLYLRFLGANAKIF
jgi:ERCC4-related helicase